MGKKLKKESKKRRLSFFGYVFVFFQRQFNNLNMFNFFNHNVISFLFMVLYALEQLWLVLNVQNNLIITIFIIMILTTFSLQKMSINAKAKLLEDEIRDTEKEMILQKTEYLRAITMLTRELDDLKSKK